MWVEITEFYSERHEGRKTLDYDSHISGCLRFVHEALYIMEPR